MPPAVVATGEPTPHSLALDGVGAYAEAADAADLELATDWTIELWFKDESPQGLEVDRHRSGNVRCGVLCGARAGNPGDERGSFEPEQARAGRARRDATAQDRRNAALRLGCRR